jgi:hypothetical protein
LINKKRHIAAGALAPDDLERRLQGGDDDI